jgi:hypothetical protein
MPGSFFVSGGRRIVHPWRLSDTGANECVTRERHDSYTVLEGNDDKPGTDASGDEA